MTQHVNIRVVTMRKVATSLSSGIRHCLGFNHETPDLFAGVQNSGRNGKYLSNGRAECAYFEEPLFYAACIGVIQTRPDLR